MKWRLYNRLAFVLTCTVVATVSGRSVHDYDEEAGSDTSTNDIQSTYARELPTTIHNEADEHAYKPSNGWSQPQSDNEAEEDGIRGGDLCIDL
jgi:hypothetical protein